MSANGVAYRSPSHVYERLSRGSVGIWSRVRSGCVGVTISKQVAMVLFVSALVAVATCVLWPTATSAAIAAPACSDASQQSAVINFFLHDDLDIKPTGSAFIVVNPISTPNGLQNTNLFGGIAVIDDKVTDGPDVNSTEIGRGRGFYVFNHLASDSTSLEFVWTLIFNNQSGYDDGSTIVFRGYDNINDVYRELAILGGTGTFRLARGWAGILTYRLIGGAAILNFTSYVYYGCNYGPIASGIPSAANSQSVPSFLTMFIVLVCTLLLPYRRRSFSTGH